MSVKDTLKELSDRYTELYDHFWWGVDDDLNKEAHEHMKNARDEDLYVIYTMAKSRLSIIELARQEVDEYIDENIDEDHELDPSLFNLFIYIEEHILKFIEEELERRGRDK